MDEVVLNTKEQEAILVIMKELLRRDGHLVDDLSDEFKSIYYKCGGK